MDNSLRLATLNVSGLQNKTKRLNTFQWIARKGFDIVFLQETHCGSETDCNKWKYEWTGQSYWTTYSSNSMGVAILINNKNVVSKEESGKDTLGRWQKLNVTFEDKDYTLINIYAPNNANDRKVFFRNIKETLTNIDMPIIIGGDFNCTLSNQDRRPTSNRIEIGRKELNKMIDEHDLEDIYRRRYPDKKEFTYFRKNTNSASRLDMWLISKSLDSMVKYVKKHVVTLTDHHAVEINIKLDEMERGPGSWKMNTQVIKSVLF